MSKDVIIRGVTYQGIDKLSLPVSGGSALFRDTSGADAAAADIVRGKTAYGASGLITGTHDLPSGSVSITDNGVYDVTDYASAVVSVSGGGGGPTASDAILTVKAPANSIVTMSKGNTTLTPTLWTTAADSGLECALFVIDPSLFDSQNAWTVTASRSGETSSATVVIDDNLQYAMTMSYWSGVFYDAGDEYSAITGGWLYVAVGSAGAGLDKQSDRMLLKGNPDGAQTVNGFDATYYTTIYFDVASSASYDSMVGISPTGGDADLDTASMIYKSAKYHNFSRQIISVNISGATGSYWPTVWTRASSAGVYIYKVWVE